MTKEQEQLVIDHQYMVHQEVKRWRHTPFEQEDLISEGYVGLINAAIRFDPARLVPFAGFARQHVRGMIVDVIRKQARKDKIDEDNYYNKLPLSLLQSDEEGEETNFDIADTRYDPVEISEHLEVLRMIKTLPDKERIALVKSAIEGIEAEEIGNELNVSAERVYKLVADAKARLERRVNEDFSS